MQISPVPSSRNFLAAINSLSADGLLWLHATMLHALVITTPTTGLNHTFLPPYIVTQTILLKICTSLQNRCSHFLITFYFHDGCKIAEILLDKWVSGTDSFGSWCKRKPCPTLIVTLATLLIFCRLKITNKGLVTMQYELSQLPLPTPPDTKFSSNPELSLQDDSQFMLGSSKRGNLLPGYAEDIEVSLLVFIIFVYKLALLLPKGKMMS